MGDGDEQEVAGLPAAVRSDVRSWPTGRLLSVAARVLERRFDEVLAGHGLTHAGLIACIISPTRPWHSGRSPVCAG